MMAMSEKSRFGERDHKQHMEHTFELSRRTHSSLDRRTLHPLSC